MPFEIAGFQRTTLIDYPEKIACIVFTQGCNFRCGYCHNPELFMPKKPVISLPAFFQFLQTRYGKLDGVVITGGEPTNQRGLKDFIKEIKKQKFLVKLDTNGSNPNLLEELLAANLIDYIAMDIKSPLEKYEIITNTQVNIENIKKSIDLIMKNQVDYEFRTTVLKSQLDFEDFKKIGELIKGAEKYCLQKFVPSKILDNSFSESENYSTSEMQNIVSLLKNYIKIINWRM